MKKNSRREFVRNAAIGSAVVTFGTNAPWALQHAAAATTDQERILVVVEMAGGNDGLNSVVMHSDPAYKKARPEIAIAKDDTLSITKEIGFHPGMQGFADLLEQSKLAIVQGVGYENPNRSHFESMDIWHSCQRKDEARSDGWVGRFLETKGLGATADPSALHLGNDKQPLALRSMDIRVPSIQDLKQFRLNVGDRESLREAISELSGSQRKLQNDLLGFVQSSSVNAIETSERMESAGVKYKPAHEYPKNGLGKKLETVAKLIVAGLATKIYYVRIDGFDTHARQPDAHASLLREVASSVNALVSDLSAKGFGDRLLVMCFSEFGRRVAENASAGTDHGTAGPVFLAGNHVNAGLIGEHPSLQDLEQGDIKHHTDFRQVYAAVLEKWMACPSEPILGKRYIPVNAIG